MKNLIYLPLESYQERYTCQLSRAKTGWLERRWLEIGQPYIRIEGERLSDGIQTGSVLDAFGRGYWALEQVKQVLKFMQQGWITSDDAIYFDDFWHPGISAIPYAASLSGIKPKMYAMLHAQSVDEFDFTCNMFPWIRLFEQGTSMVLDGIFVTSTDLRDLCVQKGVGDKYSVHICGLPYNSTEVKEHFPAKLPAKKRQVVFSSRWDWEKQPEFFLKVAEYLSFVEPSIKLVISTSSNILRSNKPELLNLLNLYMQEHSNLDVRVAQTKEQYYETLLESAVQFNCALQDWVSWTLLEATTCGCQPVYPNFRSFPECIPSGWLYTAWNEKEAGEKIIQLVNQPLIGVEQIYKPFDNSWLRMLNVMQGHGSYYSKEDWND